MKSFCKNITLETAGKIAFIDITNRVRHLVVESGVRDGLVTIYTCHTTTAVKINECCDCLQDDMLAFLESVVPNADYGHNEITVDSRPNARSHIMSLLLNVSETIPVTGGELKLGNWQSIFFIELDGPRKKRNVLVNVIGV